VINDVDAIPAQSLGGFGRAHADLVTVSLDPAVIRRKAPTRPGKAALISDACSGRPIRLLGRVMRQLSTAEQLVLLAFRKPAVPIRVRPTGWCSVSASPSTHAASALPRAVSTDYGVASRRNPTSPPGSAPCIAPASASVRNGG
jgi:hypothetical protein